MGQGIIPQSARVRCKIQQRRVETRSTGKVYGSVCQPGCSRLDCFIQAKSKSEQAGLGTCMSTAENDLLTLPQSHPLSLFDRTTIYKSTISTVQILNENVTGQTGTDEASMTSTDEPKMFWQHYLTYFGVTTNGNLISI